MSVGSFPVGADAGLQAEDVVQKFVVPVHEKVPAVAVGASSAESAETEVARMRRDRMKRADIE